jgi:hypothetical protein
LRSACDHPGHRDGPVPDIEIVELGVDHKGRISLLQKARPKLFNLNPGRSFLSENTSTLLGYLDNKFSLIRIGVQRNLMPAFFRQECANFSLLGLIEEKWPFLFVRKLSPVNRSPFITENEIILLGNKSGKPCSWITGELAKKYAIINIVKIHPNKIKITR